MGDRVGNPDVELALLTLQPPAAPDVDRLIANRRRMPYPAAIRRVDQWFAWFNTHVRPLLRQLPGGGDWESLAVEMSWFGKRLEEDCRQLELLQALRPDLHETYELLHNVTSWLSLRRTAYERCAIGRMRVEHETRRMARSGFNWPAREQFGELQWWPAPVAPRPRMPRPPLRARGDCRRRRHRPRRTRGPPSDEDPESDPDSPGHVGRWRRGWAP
jgi:hypothetical protein